MEGREHDGLPQESLLGAFCSLMKIYSDAPERDADASLETGSESAWGDQPETEE